MAALAPNDVGLVLERLLTDEEPAVMLVLCHAFLVSADALDSEERDSTFMSNRTIRSRDG